MVAQPTGLIIVTVYTYISITCKKNNDTYFTANTYNLRVVNSFLRLYFCQIKTQGSRAHKGAFIIYGWGWGVGGGCEIGGGGAKNLRPIVMEGGGGLFFSILFGRGDFFFTHYFCELFVAKVTLHEILLVWEHNCNIKACYYNMVGGGGGGGGRDFFPCILEGGGALFFAYRFCGTTPPPFPAINNERSLTLTLTQSLTLQGMINM